MNFDKCDDKAKILSRLIDKTEQNINRIQNVSNSFVYPVLNEWRYATRHMANIFEANDKESENEMQKTITHLNRAYQDSCKVLLTTYLHQAFLFFKRYRYIRHLANECQHRFFADYLKQYINGRRMLDEKPLEDANRSLHYMQEIESVIANLERCHVKALELEPDFEYAREHYYKRHLIMVGCVIVSVIVTILSTFIMIWGR